MDRPLVSVIVAAYNVEAYLRECLDSILAQDYEKLELICVDDASTDNTALILDSYRQKDARVHIVHKKSNAGLSAVRNTGMDLAKGKYILVVDGDDLIAKNLLSETVSCAEKYGLDEVSFGYKIFAAEKEWSWQERDMQTPDEVTDLILTGKQMIVMREKMLTKSKGTMASVTAWAWLYNRSFLRENNLRFLEGIVHEDLLFWFQCCLSSKRVMMIDKQLYFYRKSSGSITTGWHKNRAKSLFAVSSIIYADWIKNDFSPEENEAISAFLIRSVIGGLKKAELHGETEDMEVNPAVDFCYKLMHGKLPYKFGHLTPEDLGCLGQTGKVFVYGAGSAAADVFEQLNKNHIKIMGVIVSSRKGNPSSFGGVPVKTLEEWGRIEDVPVVLAITGKYRGDIESKLRQYGYQQVITVEES